ncbi:MAG TPA: alpha/beta hydrolase [Mycobacteriales bacterium]|nr:alpha/beta hydrolase [Mycobacteriales bacterium]
MRWNDCGGGYRCATLRVPVDYEKPMGRTIPLSLIELPSTDPAHRIGTLVVDPGGPGDSGVGFLRAAGAVYSNVLRRRFDIVAFDPRGVAASAGIRCATDAQLDRLFHDDQSPTSAKGRQRYLADVQAEVKGCTRSAAQKALLAHVGTVEAATDIDTIRRALGQKTLTYFGFSYGTYLGATWVDLFPRTVRGAVLDAALDPGLDLAGMAIGQAKGFEGALDRFFAYCGCTATYDALAKQVVARPIPGGGGRTVAAGELFYAVTATVYARARWAVLAQALRDARNGDGAGLLALSDSYTRRNGAGHYDDSFDAFNAVTCLDHAAPRGEPAWFAVAQRARKVAPRIGAGVVYSGLQCAVWPVPARPARIPHGRGAPPVLVVGTTHDPATPYAWAQAMARDLDGARLLTRDGDGHTAYGRSGCVRAAVDAYLVSRTLPAKGTRCASTS